MASGSLVRGTEEEHEVLDTYYVQVVYVYVLLN